MLFSSRDFGRLVASLFHLGIFFFFSSHILWASDTNVAAPFLDISSGSRPAAMASAYTAVADDVYSLRYNPAGLGLVNQLALSFQHNEWGLDMRQEYVGGAVPIPTGTLGVGFTYMSYGTIAERDETGNRTGQEMAPTDFGLTLGYGFNQWGPDLLVGGSATFFQESLFGENLTGLSGDLGMKYRVDTLNTDLGVAVKNIGTPVSGFSLPTKLSTGAATRVLDNALLFSVDADWPLAKSVMQIALGGELTLMDFLAVRMGYRFVPSEGSANINGFTAGLGVYWENMGFSYTVQPMGEIAISHRITLDYQLDKPFIKKSSPKPVVRRRVVRSGSANPVPKASNPQDRIMPALPNIEGRNTKTEVTPEQKKAAIQHYILGKKFYAEHQVEQAIDEFTQALDNYPGFTKARQGLAVAKREKSREFVLKAIKPMSQRDTASESQRLYENGQDLERKGKWVDAAFAYKSALNVNPKLKEAEKALKRVQEQVRQQAPAPSVELSSLESTSASESGAVAGSAAVPKPAAKETDESVGRAIQKHMLAGSQALDHGDYQEAIREFELIMEFDPEHKQAKYKLDTAHRKLDEEINEAKARADGAKQSGDKLEETKALRAILVLDPNNKEARQAFKDARTKSRKEIDEYYKQGVTAYAQGRYSDAIQIWNEVLDLDPEHSKAKESIGKAREKIKLIKEQ